MLERIRKGAFDTPGISRIESDIVIVNQELETIFPANIKEDK
jgi:hypothetical protein